ncbi:hypothetical protein SAMN05216462_1965 [Xylanibacter ruminicola]|uniref:Uncharacterized protein n=1 Tax=Xylanibacter ruminicola TaxID=839 RepID=A0A1H4CHF5_XYLRU|nr:hypothetical protein SAMN05216462_1965 [Xylanibacter ruminicola]
MITRLIANPKKGATLQVTPNRNNLFAGCC